VSKSDLFEQSKSAIDTRVEVELSQTAQAYGLQLDLRDRVALACRLLADEGHARSLAGQVTARAGDGTYWTNAFGTGLAEAARDTLLRIDNDMNVIEGLGKPNPAIRFHFWIYEQRPDLASIVHTHPPNASALSLTGQPLIVAHMDATMFYNDCAYLAEWPGVPIYNEEGRIISEALGGKRSIILAHHGLLTTGASLDEALYLAIYLERACEMQLRAQAIGAILPINAERAAAGHAFMTKSDIISSSVNYWFRQTRRRHAGQLGHAQDT
jgi:L-fuculose-phosphate aldolase